MAVLFQDQAAASTARWDRGVAKYLGLASGEWGKLKSAAMAIHIPDFGRSQLELGIEFPNHIITWDEDLGW